MNIEEATAAIDDAERTMRAAETVADKLVQCLRPRIRLAGKMHRDAKELDKLKRELRDWDMTKHAWKSR